MPSLQAPQFVCSGAAVETRWKRAGRKKLSDARRTLMKTKLLILYELYWVCTCLYACVTGEKAYAKLSNLLQNT